MRQRDVIANMDIRELMEWMAYDMASNEEFRDKTLTMQNLESQKNNTAEQEAALVLAMFRGMGGNAVNK